MVTMQSVEDQLKKIGFNHLSWTRQEVRELPSILTPYEEIFECVNGFYEGGFALLVATDVRVLLIDKKPLKFLTVEDLRFDMINEIDYSHRLLGAQIRIATGSKTLKFSTANQARLRKLITHVQHCMAEQKKSQTTHPEAQVQHLEEINQQLRDYLLEQQKQQQQIYAELQKSREQKNDNLPDPIKPSNELADYLFARRLLDEHQAQLQNQQLANG
jgi:hypothetical protein